VTFARVYPRSSPNDLARICRGMTAAQAQAKLAEGKAQ